MSNYKELVRRLGEKYILGTPGHQAAYAIETLSAALEAEELTNDRLRDEIAQAVGDREKLAAEVERLKRNSYPHMCRDGHEQVGHACNYEPEELSCPVCRAQSERDDEVERLTKERDEARALYTQAEERLSRAPHQSEIDELRETVARLQQTLEAYGDGGNDGPSMHAFLGDYQLVKDAIGGSYTAEAFEALKAKEARLADIERQVRERCERICATYGVLLLHDGDGVRKRHAPECMKVEMFGDEA